MKPRRIWLDYLVYVAVRVVAAIFSMFPIEWNLRTGRMIGWIWFHFPAWIPIAGRLSRHRGRAMEHLRAALGHELSEARLEQIACRSMEHFAMLAIEVLLTPRLITSWSWARYVRLTEIGPAARALLDRRGCIMLTPHFGSFELLGYTLATVGFSITALMRPFDNEYLNRYLLDRRVRSGLRLLYKKGAMERAPEVLREGGALCFIADQDAGRKGIFVDFFGRKASTYKSIGLLAMEARVPIVVGTARRVVGASRRAVGTAQRVAGASRNAGGAARSAVGASPSENGSASPAGGNGDERPAGEKAAAHSLRRGGRYFSYEIRAHRIIEPSEWDGREDELRWITQEFSTAMEQAIRAAPEQYLWIHRRWKSRPKGESA